MIVCVENASIYYKKNLYKKMSLKTAKRPEKMLETSPISNIFVKPKKYRKIFATQYQQKFLLRQSMYEILSMS